MNPTVTLYCVYDSGGKSGVVLESTEAVERDQTYRCAKQISALGYRSVVPKTDDRVGLTPQEAVSKYMTICQNEAAKLDAQAEMWRRRLRIAFTLETPA